MSKLTEFLKLFKYDPVEDKVLAFNITNALNNNWDKLDDWAKKQAEIGIPRVTTTGTGAAYVATVDGIDALENGMMLTIIPHTVSTSTTPTLNVNGLGAKGIRRQQSTTTAGATSGPATSWLSANKPLTLQYNGTYWVVVGKEQPVLSDASGTLAVNKGGTGKTSWTPNRLPYPSASTSFAQLPFPTEDGSVLMQNTDGAPYWSGKEDLISAENLSGILPISKGGTGATTAAAALHALIGGSTALTADDLAEGDMIAIDDASGATGKKVTMANLVAYLSGLMGGAKIQTGSYVGTGTYGSSNPCSLTFDFVPQIVIIRLDQKNIDIFFGLTLISGSLKTLTEGYGDNADERMTSYITWDHNTVSWYSVSSVRYQLNKDNCTYHYVAIG